MVKKIKAKKIKKSKVQYVSVYDFEDMRKDLKFFTKAVAWLVILIIALMAFQFKWTYDTALTQAEVLNAVTSHQIILEGYEKIIPSMNENDRLFAEWSKEFSEKLVDAFQKLGILQANLTERVIFLEDDVGIDIGGNFDEKGCLAAAGYEYCEVTGACQRFWEKPCV